MPCGEDEVLAIVRDITDRKLVERALEKSQAQLAEAQAVAPLRSWEWGVDKPTEILQVIRVLRNGVSVET